MVGELHILEEFCLEGVLRGEGGLACLGAPGYVVSVREAEESADA